MRISRGEDYLPFFFSLVVHLSFSALYFLYPREYSATPTLPPNAVKVLNANLIQRQAPISLEGESRFDPPNPPTQRLLNAIDADSHVGHSYYTPPAAAPASSKRRVWGMGGTQDRPNAHPALLAQHEARRQTAQLVLSNLASELNQLTRASGINFPETTCWFRRKSESTVPPPTLSVVCEPDQTYSVLIGERVNQALAINPEQPNLEVSYSANTGWQIRMRP